jgi:hypothetical protein
MSDAFAGAVDSASAPATSAATITPHDSNALPNIPKAIYVGGSGDIAMRGVNGVADQLWKSVPAGSILPFRAAYVRATGTTATGLLALY